MRSGRYWERFDDKVAANKRLWVTAEQLAHARFCQLMISVSETVKVGSILALEYGKSLPASRRTQGPVEVFGSGGVVGVHGEAFLGGPGVVVGRKGTAGAIYWTAGPYYPIDTTFYVVPTSKDIPLTFCYFVLRSLGLNEMNSDSAVPGLNRNEVHSVQIRIPSRHAIGTFAESANVLFDNVAQLKRESRAIEAVRDALLPELMSGKLRVKDAEKTVEEVL